MQPIAWSSQGSVNNGDSEGGNEGAEDPREDDAELNKEIIETKENSKEGINVRFW